MAVDNLEIAESILSGTNDQDSQEESDGIIDADSVEFENERQRRINR